MSASVTTQTTTQATTPATPRTTTQECDVFIIGGGPAGSTAATRLAERGHNVVVAEKSHHPRFHIGESLLPANLPLFEELGVAEEIKAIGMYKGGAEFVSPWHKERPIFEFADGLNKSIPFAYQVRRSEFDEILFRNAAKKGAHTLEGCRVRTVEFLPNDGGVNIGTESDDGATAHYHARFLLDASGRDTFLANQFKSKKRNPDHSSCAVYAHFSNATRLPGDKEGYISLFWFQHGWFWFIPLTGGITSVGAVVWPHYMKTRKNSPQQFLLDTIAMCPPLAERLKNAKFESETHATGNFAYTCGEAAGKNYLLIGDAFAFIDPVFSSGVMLAMNSSFNAADAVDAYLKNDQPAYHAALAHFKKQIVEGPREFSWFIYRITNPTMRDIFITTVGTPPWKMKDAVISLLAGDIFGKTPYRFPLFMFKLTYYVFFLRSLSKSLAGWRKRRVDIRDVGDTGTASV